MNKRALLFVIIFLVLAGAAGWWFFFRDSGPPVETAAYSEPFDDAGTWTVGDDGAASGIVQNGVYEMYVERSGDIFWVTGGRNFADATYEVAATPIDGTIDNGYGMLFRVNTEENNFYMFKVSSDGYVYIGRCATSCAESAALVERDWFSSDAVNLGMNVTNILRVEATGSDLVFFVNGTEVGRVTDETLSQGDIGLVAETLSPGGFTVQFDNFSVTPTN